MLSLERWWLGRQILAAELGYPETVDLLAKQGADRDIRDKSGKTAFDLATNENVRRRLAGGTR
jgi:hypothetical protein